jgi:phage terminase large subunit
VTTTEQAEAPANQHVYTPYGVARQAFSCRDAELLLSGPAGTGKSRALLEKLNLIALLNPGFRGLMIRKTLSSLGSTALVTWREHVVPEALHTGAIWFHGGNAQAPAQYRYKNGSTITIGGMDKATKVMSSEYDAIYVQEAIELTEADWEALTTRLRNGKVSFQQLMADTNPDIPTHWLKARADQGRTTMLNTRHEDNPVLFDADGQVTSVGASYISKLDALTGVRKDRLRYGKWCAAEGLIYENFDPAVHKKRIVKPPPDWERYWVVDFGFTNPFVLQCWAVDPDGRLYLYRELYRSRRLVEDHARDILRIVTRRDGEWQEPKPRAIICDHDAEDRATLERHLGMSTVAATKTVSDGIQAVQKRLEIQPDGMPRIFFSPDALWNVDAKGIARNHMKDPVLEDGKKPTCTLDEIPGYVWDTSGISGNRLDKNQRETPRKENDHGMDAMRYVVAELDFAPRPRVRWLK